MRKEIPMLFSTDMVRAILEDRKKMTRRIVNPRTPEQFALMVNMNAGIEVDQAIEELILTSCPYGKKGDVIWCRETFFHGHFAEDTTICDDQECGHWHYVFFADTRDNRPGNVSEAWCYNEFGPNKECYPRWHPSIHMPKLAARIWLEVTDIRVERVQEITEADAIAEGGKWTDNGPVDWAIGKTFEEANPVAGWKRGWSHCGETHPDKCLPTARSSFGNLWESINGFQSWISNPWVWVVSFKVLSITGKPAGI